MPIYILFNKDTYWKTIGIHRSCNTSKCTFGGGSSREKNTGQNIAYDVPGVGTYAVRVDSNSRTSNFGAKPLNPHSRCNN